ncbi:hypothetical protein V5E97_33055 [Singulisphaera sp. Ch08]|uniref:Uncharacterized protein n=1 Tax=Singulisphaera sp. Ch08 TaxID=3120278 RepID=A0AAU7CDK8_9BACT
MPSLWDGRSNGSIKFKHRIISAVLVSMELPYIECYKPARKYQKAVLLRAIDDYLIRHPEILDELINGMI